MLSVISKTLNSKHCLYLKRYSVYCLVLRHNSVDFHDILCLAILTFDRGEKIRLKNEAIQ